MGADDPRPGDWFVVPNAVTGLFAPEQGGVHPLIVASAWPGPPVMLFPRSASRGSWHKAHQGSCGFASCRIDKDGEIGLDPCIVDPCDLTDYSCKEPDEEIIEWVMGGAHASRKRGRR